jgi:general secretion pathway protein N
MTTLSGPLRLEGGGTWDARSGLRFTAEASAEEPERARLQPLLGLLGRREGERTIIKIGA